MVYIPTICSRFEPAFTSFGNLVFAFGTLLALKSKDEDSRNRLHVCLGRRIRHEVSGIEDSKYYLYGDRGPSFPSSGES